MSPMRRLRGIAAFSAAALATGGLAGTVSASDECADDSCPADQISAALAGSLGGGVDLDFLRQLLESQGLDQKSIDGAMAIYEQMGLIGDGGQSYEGWPAKWYSELPELIAASGGEEIPSELMAQLGETYAQLGITLEPGGDLEALLAKATPGDDAGFGDLLEAFGGEEALIKLGDAGGEPLDGAFAKIGWAEDEAFNKLGGPLTVAEAALAQAAANGDIDQATLEAILRMLFHE